MFAMDLSGDDMKRTRRRAAKLSDRPDEDLKRYNAHNDTIATRLFLDSV